MKIFDPVHGFIHFNNYEEQLIDSYPFQRLRYIHQIGIGYLVYPGATHKRFDHSIGVMSIASQVFDIIVNSDRVSDIHQYIPDIRDKDILKYWRQVVRFAALCHDLGHLPFSHTAEDILLLHGHEEKTCRIVESVYLKHIWDQITSPDGHNVVEDILKVAIGEKRLSALCPHIKFTDWERVLSQLIIADYFGADRIDYLLRDAFFTGVSHGSIDFHQVIENLRILPSYSYLPYHISLGIDTRGMQAIEALLLSRYFMFARVYLHPTINVYTFHLRNFLRKCYVEKFSDYTLDEYLLITDSDILVDLRKASLDSSHRGHDDAKRILFRHCRYRYVPIVSNRADVLERFIDINEKIDYLKKKFGDNIAYENCHFRLKEIDEDDALCRLDNGTICEINNYSILIKHIPAFVGDAYVFVVPEFEKNVLECLAKDFI